MLEHPEPHRFSIATSMFGYAQVSLVDALRRIGAAGFRGVEGTTDSAHLAPRLNPNIAEAVAVARDVGVEFRSIHLPFSGQSYHGLHSADDWLEFLVRVLDIGAQVGASIAVLHSANVVRFWGDISEAESIERTVEWVSRLADRAEQRGMGIAVENELAGYAPRFAIELAIMAGLYTDPRIGFCLDTGHAVMGGFDCVQEIRAAGHRLIALHLNSNPGSGPDVHWLPDQGVLDWPLVKRTLIESGYAGSWTLELKPGEDVNATLEKARVLAGIA